jgi:hypothetical protein
MKKKKKYRENGSLIGPCLTNPIQKSLVRRGPIELHMKLMLIISFNKFYLFIYCIINTSTGKGTQIQQQQQR